MPADFYQAVSTYYFPQSCVNAGGVSYPAVQIYDVVDPVYGWYSFVYTLLFSYLNFANNRGYWTNGAVDKAQTFPLTSGLNNLAVDYPVSITFNLTLPPKPPNDWYKDGTTRKLGFCRRQTQGYSERAFWINNVAQSVRFDDTGFGDAIEVMLAPGVTGTAEVLTMWGPPIVYQQVSNGLEQLQIPWFFSGDTLV